MECMLAVTTNTKNRYNSNNTGTISPISTLVAPSTNYTVVGTYTSPMASGPYQSGLAIHGYKNYLTKYFSFNVTAVNIGGTAITVYVTT